MIVSVPLVRGTYIGGGDAGAIMGTDPHRSILEVYLNKTNELEKKDISKLIPVRVGKRLEDLVVELFEEETGYKINNRQLEICNAEHQFIAGHIDGDFIDGEGRVVLFEAKTTSAYMNKNWDEESNELPMAYFYQVHHYLACHPEYEYAMACVLIGNTNIKIITIDRNPDITTELIKRECEFWQMVQEHTPPEVTRASDINVMKRLYPEGEDEQLDITSEDAIEAASTLMSAQAEAKALEEIIDTMKAKLQSKMKEADKAFAGDYSMTWKSQTRNTLDTKALKEAHPDIAAKFNRESSSRVFLIKKIKKAV